MGNPIDLELIKTLRTSERMLPLFRALSEPAQLEECRLLKRGKKRFRSVRPHLRDVAQQLQRNEHFAWRILKLWMQDNPPEPTANGPYRWQVVLPFRAELTQLSPPPGHLNIAMDAVISGTADALTQTHWDLLLRWWSAASGLAVLQAIEAGVMSALKALSNGLPDPDETTDPFADWASYLETHADEKRRLETLVEKGWNRITDRYPAAIADRTPDTIWTPTARAALQARFKSDLELLEHQWIREYAEYIALPARLRPLPTARDNEVLIAERDSLLAHQTAPDRPEPSAIAPVIAALVELLIEEVALDDLAPALDEALDILSRGFSRALERGEVSLVEDTQQADAEEVGTVAGECRETVGATAGERPGADEASPEAEASREVSAGPANENPDLSVDDQDPADDQDKAEPSDEAARIVPEHACVDPAPTDAGESTSTSKIDSEPSTLAERVPDLPTGEPTPSEVIATEPEPEPIRPPQVGFKAVFSGTIPDAARALLGASDRSLTAALLKRLVLEDQLPEAVCLARAMGEEVAPWLFEILLLGRRMMPALGPRLSSRLRKVLSAKGERFATLDDGQIQVLAAALIRPALMAPHVNPSYALRVVADRCAALSEFALGLAAFTERGVPIARELITGMAQREQWDEEQAALSEEARRWLDQAAQRRVKYGAATAVWRAWVDDGGPLRTVLLQAVDGRLDDTQMHATITDWNDGFGAHIVQTDRQIRGRRAEAIHSQAREHLIRLKNDALGFIDRAQQLYARAPQAATGYASQHESLLAELVKLAGKARAQLPRTSGWGGPAKLHLEAALEELEGRFQRTTRRAEPPDVELAKLTLLVDGTDVDATLQQLAHPRSVVDLIALHVRQERPWKAEALLDHLPVGERERWVARIEEASEIAEERSRSTLERVRHLVDDAALHDVLSEARASKLAGELSSHERLFTELPSAIPDALEFAAEVETQIDVARQQRGDNLATKLGALRAEISNSAAKVALEKLTFHIARAIENRDFAVAEDHFATARDWISAGRADTDPNSPAALGFETYAEALEALLAAGRQLPRTETPIRKHAPLADLDAGSLKSLRTIFRELRELRKEGAQQPAGRVERRLRAILPELGFRLTRTGTESVREELSQSQTSEWRRFEVLASLDGCQLPIFGSKSAQRFHVVVLWEAVPRPAQWFADLTPGAAVVLLYLDPLQLEARRAVVHTLRGRHEQRMCPLILDASLIAWSATLLPGARLDGLIAAGAAGGRYNPYQPNAAGGLSPEMFFGRTRDIEDVLRPDGTCLIYGGRQLGKSALLQRVLREHAPTAKRFIGFRAVKHETDVWRVLRRVLIELDLIVDTDLIDDLAVVAAVRAVMKSDPARRVVILLDECDNLLDHDAYHNGFRGISLIRDLMTETQRRFKVVFAGLHSVQRFQRLPNQPLAHFGAPRCIRPLRRAAARELVLRPLRLLGYSFESPDLVDRILARTNRHPSLMQLFCASLVDDLMNRQGSMQRNPPYVITRTDLTRVVQSAQLMARMRERFDWTLDLDERYRVIGYTAAVLELMHDPGEAWTDRFFLGQLREYWPQAFDEVSIEELGWLFDELDGLGILIEADRCHRLRSPNVLRLLGGRDGVERELEKWAERPYAPASDPSTVHRIQENGPSPLSLRQESELLTRSTEVILVCGSLALRIDLVAQALIELFEQETDGCLIKHLVAPAEHTLSKAITARRKNTRWIVERGTLGAADFVARIAAARDALDHDPGEHLAQVVVIADAESRLAFGDVTGMRVMPLRRWQLAGLKQWLDDREQAPTAADEPQRWIEDTGGWSILLEDRVNGRAIDVPVALDATAARTPAFVRYLEVLADYGEPVDPESLAELLETPLNTVRRLLDILGDLALVDVTESSVRLAPLIARLFER